MIHLQCSFFRSATDNTPGAWEGTWEQLREVLERNHIPQAGLASDEAKKSLPAICGARFQAGTRRARANVVELGLMLFDFDNAQEEPTGTYWLDPNTGLPSTRPKFRKVCLKEPVSFHDVQEALSNAGTTSYTWTTWSNKPDWPKFRVLVPLAHPVPADLWEPATEWALKHLRFDAFRRGLDLPVLRDTARLNFLPGAWDPALIKRQETNGQLLSITLEQLNRAAVPSLRISSWQSEIQAERKQAHEAGEHWFNPYYVGSLPVDFRSLDLPALLSGRGIQVGRPQAYGSGTKWRTHCPWAHEHSNGIDDDSAVVFQTPGQWPSFKCSHSHHAHLGLQDLIELFWGRP